MDIDLFCRELPKVELHAHLNGSLSQATLLQLQRYHADKGIVDKTNAFFDEFQIGAGDTRSLSDCFQVFSIAHSLTSMPETLEIATKLTLQEFQDDGCCYIELRSTPRQTEYMTKKQYLDTLIQTIRKASVNLTMISRLIVSINRASPLTEAVDITNLAIEAYRLYPDVIVGIEISGNPMVGQFEDFIPLLVKAKKNGLKKCGSTNSIIVMDHAAYNSVPEEKKETMASTKAVMESWLRRHGVVSIITLHCGEVYNPEEVLKMLKFKPDRIGHGICIHPRLGGTGEAWSLLCESKIPVEVCLTSNVNTKSTPDYDSHHFKELYDAEIPIIICTDDKGVFATSLSQEYRLCGETFNLTPSQLSKLSLNACQHVFAVDQLKTIHNKLLNFIKNNSL